MYNIIVCVFMG